jgi:hypothetical protein
MTSALAAKAALASPAFTGNPTAPTQAAGNNTTRIASTAFVQQEIVSGKKIFTADGAISAGEVVVLTAAGEVAPVASSLGADTMSSEQVHLSAATTYYGCIQVPGTNTYVLMYTGFLVVAEVDPNTNTVTFGTPVAFSYASTAKLAWHTADNCLAIAYVNTTIYVQAATISGTTLTLGTAVNSSTTPTTSVLGFCYQAHQAKLIVSYLSSANAVSARAVHVAATVVTFHSATVIQGSLTSTVNNGGVVEVPGTPYFLVTYQGSSAYNFRACELNATTISVGGVATAAPTGVPTVLAHDTASGKILAINPAGTSFHYSIVTPSTTGTSAPTVGTATTLSGWGNIKGAVFDPDSGMMVLFGREQTTNYGIAALATLGATTLTISSTTYVNSSTTDTLFVDYNPTADRVLFVYQDEGNLDYGTVRVWDTGDIVTDADDWIGIAAEAIADNASGVITVKGGINTAVSGLTPGEIYYIEDDGDLSQINNGRKAGVALSATSIFLTGSM